MTRFDPSVLAYRVYGRLARSLVKDDGDLADALFAAAIPRRADRYLAEGFFWATVSLLIGIPLTALVLYAGGEAPGLVKAVVVMVLGVLPPLATLTAFLASPYLKKGERAREIDANLPHGLSYLLALAASGLQPRDMFRSLARQPVYGALADEAGLITRDLELLGMDLLTALRSAQERSASEKFREFLQGAISAFGSGVDLETYLRAKGEQYTREEIEAQRQSLDVIGLMAETFLVVVVAAPLFLLVLLSVMTVNQGRDTLTYGFLVALVYLPISQFGIGFIVHSMNPKVWS